MHRIATLASLCLALAFYAQAQTAPTITSAYSMPAVGYTDSIVLASGSNVGASGSGVTWDFSGLSTTPIGKFSIEAPATTPYASTFPGATHAIKLTPMGSPISVYEYYTINTNGWYINASGYSTATPNNNYTPNSKLRVPIPFSLGNSKTDTFQKVGSGLDAYAITFDGYGTLKVPGATYNNVVRMKYQWVGGEIAYNWFTTSPFFYVATWSQDNGGQFNFLGKGLQSTAIANTKAAGPSAFIYPKPAHQQAFLRLHGLASYENISCSIRDISGRLQQELKVQGAFTAIPQANLPAGLYSYQVRQNGQLLASGTLTFE